jgi:hypothetical protein
MPMGIYDYMYVSDCPDIVFGTDPEMYYYTSETLNGLHRTIGTVNGLHGTVTGTLNGLHGTIVTEKGTLSGLHGTIRTENGWNALAAILKFTFRKLSLFIIVILCIYLQTLRHLFVE